MGRTEGEVPEADGTLKDLEREAIERALNQVGGNRRRAAEFLRRGFIGDRVLADRGFQILARGLPGIA